VAEVGVARAGRNDKGGSPNGGPPRERIVEAALELLAEGGTAALTLRTVGIRVGLHNSSLFHHFPAKRDIVGAVQARVNDGLRARLEPLAADDPPRLERLVAVLRELSDHYAAHPGEARCALRLLLDPVDGAAGGRSTTALWSWLARAKAAGAIRPVSVGHVARGLLGIVLVEATWPGSARPSPRDDVRRRTELAAFVEGALRPATSDPLAPST
jgi:AcrR family transcriptional regulator